jgi:hypothetical protein
MVFFLRDFPADNDSNVPMLRNREEDFLSGYI